MSDEEDYERLAYTQRLKAAVHYTTGKICDDIAEEEEVTFSRQTIATLSETAYKYSETLARDLSLFAKHAKRSTITADDVKLACRKTPALLRFIKGKSDEIAQANEQAKAKRKKGKSKAAKAVPAAEPTEEEDA